MNRINYDYLKSENELPLLIKSEIKNIFKTKSKNSKKILIINSGLIGDFVSDSHAIRNFIKKTGGKVDIAVSPIIKSLAEKIRGINKVLVATSICERDYEKSDKTKKVQEKYDLVLVMRISPASYNLLKSIKYNHIMTYLKSGTSFFLNNTFSILMRRKFKQWREFSFDTIGEKEKTYSFDEIFDYKKEDYKKINRLSEMSGDGKKVIIHTGSGWPIKLWEDRNWVELIEKINKLGKFKFIFIGSSKQEEDSFIYIKSKLKFKVYSLINKVNLAELMIVLRTSNYFIGIDSGPRNMAHLADIRSVSLLGPGPKIFMPMNKKDVVIDKSNCFCTNYFCYKKKTCIEKITVDDVLSGFKKISKIR